MNKKLSVAGFSLPARPLSAITAGVLLAAACLVNPAIAASRNTAVHMSKPLVAMPKDDVFAVNAGGEASDGFTADAGFTAGDAFSNASQIVDTANTPNAAPASVYQDARQGDNFSYAFGGLEPVHTYAVILHFTELYWSLPHQRVFDVAINGNTVLSYFDIVQVTGGPFRPLVEAFFVKSDADGKISVDFKHGAVDHPTVSAIEIRGDNN